jgi:hypothetical protein
MICLPVGGKRQVHVLDRYVFSSLWVQFLILHTVWKVPQNRFVTKWKQMSLAQKIFLFIFIIIDYHYVDQPIHSEGRSVMVKNAWLSTSTFAYFFLEWWFIKLRENVTFIFHACGWSSVVSQKHVLCHIWKCFDSESTIILVDC